MPEILIAVLHEHRGQGIGQLLLSRLVELARQEQLPGLSLSVEHENRAFRLYEQVGFRGVATSGGGPRRCCSPCQVVRSRRA